MGEVRNLKWKGKKIKRSPVTGMRYQTRLSALAVAKGLDKIRRWSSVSKTNWRGIKGGRES